jgi:hypothetical protein
LLHALYLGLPPRLLRRRLRLQRLQCLHLLRINAFSLQPLL